MVLIAGLFEDLILAPSIIFYVLSELLIDGVHLSRDAGAGEERVDEEVGKAVQKR